MPDVCDAYAETLCEQEAACDPFGRPPRPDCREREQLACSAWRELSGSSLDAAAVERCTDDIMASDCERFRSKYGEQRIAGCQPGPGTLPNGAGCIAGAQCASGYCTGFERCGTCQTPISGRIMPWDHVASEGEACASSLACNNRYLTCTEGRCSRYGPRPGAQEACESSSGCGEGLFCDSRETMRCLPLPTVAEGARCGLSWPGEPNGACVRSLYCGNQSDRGVGTCMTHLADGERCLGPCPNLEPGRLCTLGECAYPALCLEDGRCSAPGSRSCR